MQTATTLEQSERLLNLGIDPNTADMCYMRKLLCIGEKPQSVLCVGFEQRYMGMTGYIPAWSLSALIDLLPTPIFYKNRRQASMNIIRAHDGKSWHISYDFKPDAVSISGKTLIDAAVRTLEYINDRQNRIRIGINE